MKPPTVDVQVPWFENETLRTRWRDATAAAVSALLDGQEPDQFLRVVARASIELVDGDVATIGVPWVAGKSLKLRVAVGYRGSDLEGVVFPVDESLSGRVLGSGRGMCVPDATASRNAYQPICELGDMGPTMLAPLTARGHAFGTLLVARRRGRTPFTSGELDLLSAFADHAALASEFATVREELERLTAVATREHVARTVHDTVVQHLFAIGLELQAAAAQWPGPLGERVEEVTDRLNDIITVIRSSVLESMPETPLS